MAQKSYLCPDENGDMASIGHPYGGDLGNDLCSDKGVAPPRPHPRGDLPFALLLGLSPPTPLHAKAQA